MSDPVSLAKEKNMSTVFEVVEISSETLEETTVSDPVTNPVHGLPSNCHQRSLFHYINSHTTQTVTHHPGLHFPCSIALILLTCSHGRHLTLKSGGARKKKIYIFWM